MRSSPALRGLTSLPDNLHISTQTSPAEAQDSSVTIAQPISHSSAVAIAPVPTIVVSEIEGKESWWTKNKKGIVSAVLEICKATSAVLEAVPAAEAAALPLKTAIAALERIQVSDRHVCANAASLNLSLAFAAHVGKCGWHPRHGPAYDQPTRRARKMRGGRQYHASHARANLGV
jgi:hypothetical protein